MDSNLCNMITNAQLGDSDDLYNLILKFNPLLSKYSKLLNYEDAKCDITLCFIEIINKIPINKNFTDDKFILSYINKGVRNSFINISRNKNKINTSEYICEIQDFNNKVDFHSDLEFYDFLKYLTDKEKEIIILKYFDCLSDIQISKKLSMSRQYINRLNRKALSKIKSNIA